MNPETFNETLDKIKEKIGDEQSAIIADDLGILITANEEALNEKKQQAMKIEELESTKQQLIASNGNLLKRIPINEENSLVPKSQNQSLNGENYNPMDAFDSFGRLKK